MPSLVVHHLQYRSNLLHCFQGQEENIAHNSFLFLLFRICWNYRLFKKKNYKLNILDRNTFAKTQQLPFAHTSSIISHVKMRSIVRKQQSTGVSVRAIFGYSRMPRTCVRYLLFSKNKIWGNLFNSVFVCSNCKC